MNKLWLRISLTFLILLFFALLGVGFFLANVMKHTYIEMTRNQLIQHAQFMKNAIGHNDLTSESQASLQEQLRHYASSVEARMTLINEQGKVLADSEDHPEKMENHSKRPEFLAVIRDKQSFGEAIHYSETLGYEMLYVTIPVTDHQPFQGVIRAAVSLEQIAIVMKKIWISVITAMAITFIFAGLISMRLAKGITRPIEEIIDVSTQLAEKDYDSRVKIEAKGEIKQLSRAINILAASLQEQMKEIRENEQRLTGVLTNMASGVLLVNQEGEIVLVNKAMEQMLDTPSASLIGKFHMETSKSFGLSQLIERSLSSDGVDLHDEIHLYYPKERILDAHVASYLDDTGELQGIVAVLHDITEIRRLEKMRSEFVANVSHELKTPVTAVKGFAETLLDGGMEDEDTTKAFLQIIYDESDRLHRLIRDILQLTKIEQHRIPLLFTEIDMIDVVRKTVATLQDTAQKKQIRLLVPQASQSIMIEAEKDRIQQIILNLVANAITHTSEGGTVQVDVLEQDAAVALIVRDNGAGIPKQDLERIFERFYRVDKARARHSGGTGLGLAIVKHLVDSHHGNIEVHSEEGEGTAFTITLPKKQPKADREN